MDFTEIFCYVDDFFQELDKHTNSITNHNNKSGPKSRLNRSEVITIIIGYWQNISLFLAFNVTICWGIQLNLYIIA
ncbi:hypothetical protein REIS_0609 [Rickettsia endosymbiont of Ixodes scapularis]|nr:hypothetical protein REIS_0609 [Rickettsia endosymbiont of Ixodes scapularis]